MVLKPEKEKEAEAIFRKWGLDFAVVGETTPSKRFIVRHGGDVMADLPIKELGDQAPDYKRPFVSAAKPAAVDAESVPAPVDAIEALGDPNHPHPIMQAFAEEAGVQCGYCVPGMILTTHALLEEKPRPSEASSSWP